MFRDFWGFVNTQVSFILVFKLFLSGVAQESVELGAYMEFVTAVVEFWVGVPRSAGRYCREKSDGAWVGGHNLQPQVLKALSSDTGLKLFLFRDRSEGDSSLRGAGVMWFALKI